MCFQQGDGKPTVVIPSDTEPRQARSRWAEQQQLEPPLHFIHSSFSPSLGEGQEAGGAEEEEEGEGEGDFHPQSLESLLVGGEEEEEEEDDAEEEVKEVSALMRRRRSRKGRMRRSRKGEGEEVLSD